MAGKVEIVFDHFPRIAREAEGRAKDVVDLFTLRLRDEATHNISAMKAVDTGALHNSGYVLTNKGSDYAMMKAEAMAAAARHNRKIETLKELPAPSKELLGIVAFLTAYAIYVHDGTSKMAGRPFLTLAAEALRNPFIKAMREVVKG